MKILPEKYNQYDFCKVGKFPDILLEKNDNVPSENLQLEIVKRYC